MTYGITGIKAGLGPGQQVPLRREIDEWWFSKDVNDLNQRSLYIYALQRFMDMPPNPDDPSDLSFFSIAGIHGQPKKPWDTTNPKTGWYCSHNEVTFPPWHRPYMLLYEQRLYEIMKDVIAAGTFADADKEAMKHAANTWRLPFWDWAIKKPAWDVDNPDSPVNLAPAVGRNCPYIVTQKKVQVKTATGVATVSNPMWKYNLPANPKFPNSKTFGDYGITDRKDWETKKPKHYSACIATSRHPTTFDPSDGDYTNAWIKGDQLNWKVITSELRNASIYDANTLPEAVYRLFSFTPKFPQFATDRWEEGQPVRTYGSLEQVHNSIHGCTGGVGHMGDPAVAAFDPIFWLHHCNIDRLFAMWQDLYDEKYENWLQTGSQAGDKLLPFHTNTGSYYDSKGCSYQQKDLGYTYPELQRWLPEYMTNGVFDKAKYQKQIRATIELKYSTTGKSALQLPKNFRIAEAHMANLAPMNLAVENFPPPLVKLAAPAIQAEAKELPTPVAQAEAQQVTLVAAEAPEAAEPSVLSQATQTVAEAAQSVLSSVTPSGPADGPFESWNELDYVVNVVFSPFDLQGEAYTIRFFLGDVPPVESNTFEYLHNQVGIVYNFSGPEAARGASEEGCENCKAKNIEGALGSGQVVLTDYLVENIASNRPVFGEALTTLSKETVVQYLKKNLHWRITNRDNLVIDRELLPSLKIAVGVSKVTHYLEVSRFTEYEPYEILWDVTADRPGGAGPGELGWSITGT